MVRVVNPLDQPGVAIRRAPADKGGSDETMRPALTLVRSSAHRPHPHRGMWKDDPIADPTAYTRLEDWPEDDEFIPLIAAARAQGDHMLAAQLAADRAFCAGARRRLSEEGCASGSTSA